MKKLRLPRCRRCGKPIVPGTPAFHAGGVPVLHRSHYGEGYTPLQAGRWSELVAATRELAEGSGPLAASRRPPAGVRRGYKPDLETAERMQYEREEARRRARR
jgi:hypothetical protein